MITSTTFWPGIALVGACSIWCAYVNDIVPAPYLDEVFHVRQAKAYCDGNFKQWDPKITTPPGLYLAALPYAHLLGGCSIPTLRALNIICLVLMFIVLSHTGFEPQVKIRSRSSRTGVATQTALNIALFPPLFFFSGLFYTDIISTLAVLLFLKIHYARLTALTSKDGTPQGNLLRVSLLITLGLFALLCRQTNIIWVGIFPAISTAFEFLKSEDYGGRETDRCVRSVGDVIRCSWESLIVYDPPVEFAEIVDYPKATLSVCIVAIRRFRILLSAVIPYVALLLIFCTSVYLNGGVVLGDKTNHVITLHFPQMLYIWPYIVFFSWPICIPALYTSLTRKSFPNIWAMSLVLNLALVAVHYNTVIHPFILADNRHYVFYVFRILRRHVAIKYIVTPIYVFCGWLALRALGNRSSEIIDAPLDPKHLSEKTVRVRRTKDNSSPPCTVSFVLAWLIACTLCLVTVPLVEPRYFIIPWVLWRYHLPSIGGIAAKSSRAAATSAVAEQSFLRKVEAAIMDQRIVLILETLWFAVVNSVTGYLFLYKGFIWPQEPGNLQRFMW
ncbi:hypothetical protein P152DRAFT_101638 [Eremomyces bilateralis CBS 781.70]|uniref:Dol-P-Glc:Glc(2)Man(9)GlcNAc(2)-PP-Dol alpha-1,2-glucosyltransferase n=1 Tax=Eremomyces bilateralis CBS 781.70 TaxID=1392243 RepID=A0A6G1FWR6_9PEZI|nr:uncharacterized protein P152DRAFT_101638 [Eremomyces bilateralis CBS 781.70]KAF1810178.1 hypothetical protein P152DRAFT_101638 [Eremomyces bilateralis CBS 781.70]